MPAALNAFLTDWLGAAPRASALEVVGCERRSRPGWDGRVEPVVGVGTVLSVPPARVGEVRDLLRDPDWHAALPALLGAPARPLVERVFRYTDSPAPLPDVGTWVSAAHPALPEWLRSFGPDVLAILDDGEYVAGAGLKRHTPTGHEIAIGTAAAWEGRGYARALVAQAARAVLAAGALPTYAHARDNLASARVAEAAGFPDRGLRLRCLVDVDL